MFVLGAITDDLDTIRRTADFATGLGIDTVQFLILTPLPGTPLFNDIMGSGKLLHRDWSKYDVQHVVFRPQLMSPITLQMETLMAMGRFYSWRYILGHLARMNFHYAAIGFFGKTTVDITLRASTAYLDKLGFAAE